MTKQEAIKQAYGEYWDKMSEEIDRDGYIPHEERFRNVIEGIKNISEFDELNTKLRPSSLTGIETNNGWIKIESEDDLPKESGNVWFILKTEQDFSGIYAADFEMFKSHNTVPFDVDEVAYYQPIVKPKPPIY